MRRLTSPPWLAGHVLTAVLVLGFLALGWWQIDRATGGNTLSWGYAFEWPLFAGFVLFVWTREVRRVWRGSHAPPAEPPREPTEAAADPSGYRRPVLTARRSRVNGADPNARTGTEVTDDPQLAAYNTYLAWLNAHPDARPHDYPG
jgi:hypothetical protein